jgi:hypothetical protein
MNIFTPALIALGYPSRAHCKLLAQAYSFHLPARVVGLANSLVLSFSLANMAAYLTKPWPTLGQLAPSVDRAVPPFMGSDAVDEVAAMSTEDAYKVLNVTSSLTWESIEQTTRRQMVR